MRSSQLFYSLCANLDPTALSRWVLPYGNLLRGLVLCNMHHYLWITSRVYLFVHQIQASASRENIVRSRDIYLVPEA